MQAEHNGASQDRGGIGPTARAALTGFLSVLGPAPAAGLLGTARLRVGSPGELLLREEETDRVGLLIDGMLGTVVSLPDGQMATIQYLTPVAFFGLPTIFFPVSLSVHVVRKATVIELDANEMRRCAREFREFGWFLSRQLAGAVCQVPAIVAEFGFKTVTQRVASHIISLAQPESPTGNRTAYVTQVALAEHVGSVREVIARSLRSLSDDGMVSNGRGSVRIIDEVRLRVFAGKADAESLDHSPGARRDICIRQAVNFAVTAGNIGGDG